MDDSPQNEDKNDDGEAQVEAKYRAEEVVEEIKQSRDDVAKALND